MDITNLTQVSQNTSSSPSAGSPRFSLVVFFIVAMLGVGLGLILSRRSASSPASPFLSVSPSKDILSADKISSPQDLVVGKTYGNTDKNFKDIAVGTIEKGNINGEGTHILNREGGLTQRASLTSSALDLDLFVGRKVEVRGETNASNKTGWLLDVGNVKILE